MREQRQKRQEAERATERICPGSWEGRGTPEWGSLTPTLAGGAWWTGGGQEDEVWGEGAEGEESLGHRGGVSR